MQNEAPPFPCRPVFSNFSMHYNHLWCLLNHSSWGCIPELQIQKMWRGTRELAFPSSQVMLMLLGLGEHSEHRCSTHLVTGSRLRQDYCLPHEIKMVKYRKYPKEEKHLKKCGKSLPQEMELFTCEYLNQKNLPAFFTFQPPPPPLFPYSN